jgi:hypothetical protein
VTVSMHVPSIAVLLPEGWIRLRFDDTISSQIDEVVAFVARGVDTGRRDLARVQLRRLLQRAAADAQDRAYELWMPIAPTGGVTIPLTMTVAPSPAPLDPARSAGDHLTAFAASAPGAQFVDIGGRAAVRVASDVPGRQDEAGEWLDLPRRRIITLVAPHGEDDWIVFFAEIVVPQEGAAEIVAACEFFVDAFLKTVRFPGGPAPAPTGE